MLVKSKPGEGCVTAMRRVILSRSMGGLDPFLMDARCVFKDGFSGEKGTLLPEKFLSNPSTSLIDVHNNRMRMGLCVTCNV